MHNNESLAPLGQRYSTFEESLQEWMQRSPFLAIAVAVHVLLFLVLAAIPWQSRTDRVEIVIAAAIAPPPVDRFEEPVEPPPEVVLPKVTNPDPVDFQNDTEDVEKDANETDDDMDDRIQSPFTSNNRLADIGLGSGGASGVGSLGRGHRRTNREADRATDNALEWLADHQSPDGRWDCDGFMDVSKRDGPRVDGAGDAAHDVGVTGLALLAFLGLGDTMREGLYAPQIKHGIAWLVEQQDRESGLIGTAIGQSFLYNHSIATLALCEAYRTAPKPLLRTAAQRAVNLISRARNPYGAWRYALPASGESDTSVTGWMVFALAAAHHAGLEISQDDLRGASSWIDEVTDPATGRTGYDRMGGASSRLEHLADAYPAEASEAMTAVGMLCRILVADITGPAAKDKELLAKGAELLLERLPHWSDDGSTCDMYAWYYGSYAMFQYGSIDKRAWTQWELAMSSAILPHQRTEPRDADGSWDPIGPWGEAGGRVYSTAMMVLCLEVYFRYGKLIGSR